MKNRGLFLFSALFLTIGLVAAYQPDPVLTGEKESVIVQTMLKNLERYHYEPLDIDDDFSEKVFDYYMNDLDGARLFFTQEDVRLLTPYRQQIDDQAKMGSLAFFDVAIDRWKQALDKTEKYYQEILAGPIDLESPGTIDVRDDNSEWAANEKELRAYWTDYLRRDVVRQIVDKQEELAKDTTGATPPTLAEMETEIREKTAERYGDWYKRMRETKMSVLRSQYLNAMTSMFDPHTTYFRPKDKESFDIRFSGRLEGIGATLQTTDEYTKVTTLVVGGPAWKAKELEVDDLIMAVRQEDKKEAVDIKGMQIEDVVDKIRGPKGTKVFLKIKKPDGKIEEIMIVRDVVVIDDRFAKSLILRDDQKAGKVGYINLPSFYADFQNEDGRFSAVDVAAEIEKLSSQNVDGIILDLRNNGGGSLRDVVDMSGFFIPEGPIVQVAGRNGSPEILRDKDARVQYDGPLVVMVNQYSASASEILAAALQDYKRAVIVGSTSTFGKGTVQRFIDLDRTLPGRADIKPLGTVKLTMQKFYRINGGSTQLRGVVPDIILPDSRSLLETGEKQQTNPLAWTEIEAADYDQDVLVISDDEMSELRRRSSERVAGNKTFQLIEKNAERVKRQRDRNSYPLALTDYQEMDRADKTESEMYEDLFEDVVNPGVFNIEVDLEEIHADESKDARNEDFKKTVSKDIYVREAVAILRDMIQG